MIVAIGSELGNFLDTRNLREKFVEEVKADLLAEIEKSVVVFELQRGFYYNQSIYGLDFWLPIHHDWKAYK